MKVSCPHCSQSLELTPDVLASLQGQPHFECPSCQGLIAVPAQPQRPIPRRPQPPASAAATQAQRGMNRNVLVLGVVALVVLGGIAAFLAARGGSITNIFQNTTNNIIHNNYFTQLIASGATTMEDLKSVEEIRPYGDGFIGISKAQLTWSQAGDLAKRTGSEVLAVEDSATGTRQKLIDWVGEYFSAYLSSSVWVRELGNARILDGSEVLAVTAMDRQRKALLHWQAYPAEPKTLEEALLNYRWEWAPTSTPPYLLTFDNDGTASCPGLMWHWKIIGPQTAVAFDATDRGVRLPDFKATLQFDAGFTSLKAATDNGHFHYTGRRMDLKPRTVANDAGFESLFNGRDLTGFRGGSTFDPRKLDAMPAEERAAQIAKWTASMRQHWRVENGELINDGMGDFATTEMEFGDFELLLEYKTVPGADSGIYLRGYPQVQIWDNTQTFDPKKPDRKPHLGSGGLFNNTPNTPGRDPLVNADKPFGEWNKLRIVMTGDRVSVWLNDQLVVDRAALENHFDRTTPIAARGPIQFQTHGGEIRFRNIRIRQA